MFCPKCGTQNPENGKFCRSCGTDLGNVSQALTMPSGQPLTNRKGREVSLEGAITKFATGLAFLAIALVLAFTNMAGGRVWWFWMLIPAFVMIGSSVAQYLQLKAAGRLGTHQRSPELTSAERGALPGVQTRFAHEESPRYRTGDLVPPSVTDGTTRHLETRSEDRTAALPKNTDPL